MHWVNSNSKNYWYLRGQHKDNGEWTWAILTLIDGKWLVSTWDFPRHHFKNTRYRYKSFELAKQRAQALALMEKISQ
jgi:hypothetical protein